jgi:antitoxin YefM
MLTVNYSTLSKDFKNYCDKVTNDKETIIVTRKGNKNLVMIDLDEWNELCKAARDVEYIKNIDSSFAQLQDGKGVLHELISNDN